MMSTPSSNHGYQSLKTSTYPSYDCTNDVIASSVSATTAFNFPRLTPIDMIQFAALLSLATIFIPLQTVVLKNFYEKGSNGSIAWLLAFAVNCIFVSLPGRFDNSNITAEGGPWRSLFAPAPWAFAIWGVIYLSEAVLSVSAPFLRNDGLRRVLAAAAPWWIAANSYQSLWCLAFRPKYGNHLWFPAMLLLGGAVSLLGALNVISASLIDVAGKSHWSSIAKIALLRFPLSLHAGWLSAATLLNFNGWATYSKISLGNQIALVFGSVYTAFILGTIVSIKFRDPFYAFTIAWATAALMYQTRNKPLDVDASITAAIAKTEEILYKALIAIGIVSPFVDKIF